MAVSLVGVSVVVVLIWGVGVDYSGSFDEGRCWHRRDSRLRGCSDQSALRQGLFQNWVG